MTDRGERRPDSRREGDAPLRVEQRRPGDRERHDSHRFGFHPRIDMPVFDHGRRPFTDHRHPQRRYTWSGYNHHSRRSIGIHFYDPFYYEWIFCGGRYYYWRGISSSSFNSYYLWDYNYEPESYTVAAPETSNANPICFPPNIPPLGTPPPAVEINPGAGAPGALLAYLNEPFYASLSTRLVLNNLLEDQRQALYQYRDQRDAELSQLQRELDLAAGRSPEQARYALQAFAEQQTPRLRALEARAELLRVEFQRRGLAGVLLGSGNWNERREYYLRLGETDSDETGRLHLDYLLLRAAAFYQDGLSRIQRDLLREASAELQVQAFLARGGVENVEAQDQYLYFSPGMVQIPVGPATPTHIVRLLQAYTDQKASLKQNLIDRLHALDSQSEPRRKAALEQFARDQQPSYDSLERMAELVRIEISRFPDALDLNPGASPLPSHLVARIDALGAKRSALAQEFEQQFQLFNRSASPGQVRVQTVSGGEAPDPDEPPMLTLGVATRMPEAQRDELRERLRVFNESNQVRHQALRQEQAVLQSEIEAILRSNPGMAPGLQASQLLENQLAQSRVKEVSDRYSAYRQAALQPGLSLEQRRLLLGAALAHLRLPLPGAE